MTIRINAFSFIGYRYFEAITWKKASFDRYTKNRACSSGKRIVSDDPAIVSSPRTPACRRPFFLPSLFGMFPQTNQVETLAVLERTAEASEHRGRAPGGAQPRTMRILPGTRRPRRTCVGAYPKAKDDCATFVPSSARHRQAQRESPDPLACESRSCLHRGQ